MGLSRSCLVVPRETHLCPQYCCGWGIFPPAPPCHLLQVSFTVKDCAPGFLPLLPPTVVALPGKVPPVTFYLSAFVHLLPPSRLLVLLFFFFVIVNNRLLCFPVSLPLKANFTYWDPFPCFFIFKLYSITIIIPLLPVPFQFSSSQ